ncbi:MAG: caspase family protein [Fimbriimonadaceae bacterium]|nr:caspase family protein [Fimbriimonadaceae bacterium]
MMRRLIFAAVLFGVAASAMSQSWSNAYEKGLSEARAGNWASARTAFKQAAAYRPDDVSGPTFLPGPATERRQWREGASYSPNFLGAYSGYRQAAGMNPGPERTDLYQKVAAEFEILITKGQHSYETFYFLNVIYGSTGERQKQEQLDTKFGEVQSKMSWKVDTEVVAPEEMGEIGRMKGQAPPQQPANTGGAGNTGGTGNTGGANTGGGTVSNPGLGMKVAPLANKYALVIGNSESKLAGNSVPFASANAQAIRLALTTNGGYAEANVDVVLNATAAQIKTSAEALASRIPDGATIFIYFAGAGTNIEGKDFLAGVDTELSTDTSSMVAKSDIYRFFLLKGARIFAFFEANRPINGGRYFGMEVPTFGSVAQGQATMPGENVFSYVRNGQEIGIYADSITHVLGDFRSNRIPISEFGWQVFYRMKGGGTSARGGGGSPQTPTLPYLTLMSSDAQF